MSETTKYYSIKELFSADEYIIPIYQRNYAWGEPEITQLIQDIVDYYQKDKKPLEDKPNYYIGSLITYERKVDDKSFFETIDGQQRLTTLTILLILIKREYSIPEIDFYKNLNLSFDSRPLSTEALKDLFNTGSIDSKECNIAIKKGYEIAKKALKKILNDCCPSIKVSDFSSYFFDKVKILRILVPEDTDLNHYFEIMNSRGEQLEKHEILKAKMLEILDEQDRYAFNLIWEACSNMEQYVQYGFSVEQRNTVFGDNDKDGNKWNTLSVNSETYYSSITNKEQQKENSSCSSIKDLIEQNVNQIPEKQNNDDSPDRFNTVINFANLLLHILRIQTKQDISLDDKRLIELFEPFLKKDPNNEKTNKNFVKLFGFNLLKGKFLFDKYIIRREFTKGSDAWSLKRLKWYEQVRNKNAVSYINTFGDSDNNNEINREILMLLAMFHVSTPTLVYKHWLNGAMKFLFENYGEQDFSAKSYKEYLEKLAQAFLYDKYLATKQNDYFEIIYTNNGESKENKIDENKLNQGTDIENFIFNYLDYLLWQNYRTEEKEYFIDQFKGAEKTPISDKKILDKRILDFEYTFRSSVEHYYPQHPIKGNTPIEERWLNDFGNLCLISSSKNARLSNYMPEAKKDHYANSTVIDSIKQRIMMEYDSWGNSRESNINQIEQHGKKMKEILLKDKKQN